MITTTKIRIAMIVLWLGMLVTSWDVLWLCLICITAVDVLDSRGKKTGLPEYQSTGDESI